jgi:hypothetical protein
MPPAPTPVSTPPTKRWSRHRLNRLKSTIRNGHLCSVHLTRFDAPDIRLRLLRRLTAWEAFGTPRGRTHGSGSAPTIHELESVTPEGLRQRPRPVNG